MLFGVGIILLIIAHMFRKFYVSWINPASIFSTVWGAIFLLYSLKLFQIYSVDNITIVVFLLGITSFLIGCAPVSFSVGREKSRRLIEEKRISYVFCTEARFAFLIVSIFATVIFIFRAIHTIPFWAGGVSAVKQANAEGYINNSSWINILYTFFASPIEILSVFVIAIDFFFERSKFSKIQMLMTLLMLVFGYIASGSKFLLFVPVVAFFIVFFVYRQDKKSQMNREIFSKIPLWKKTFISMIFILIAVFLIYMLSKKYGGWIESVYMYLVGCIPCGDHAITDMLNGEHYYGMVSLNGVFRVISQILALVGIKAPYTLVMNDAYDSMLVYERAIKISPSVSYNAFISTFSYFYKDGGIWGVLIGSLIFGRMSYLAYRHLVREKSTYRLLVYLFVCYIIMFSIVRMQLFLAPTVMILVYIIIFFRRKV